ncbi:MAG: M50 family metallopeptidase [Fimbriimonadaceae bacterium]|nr:M50 family metallopeptidase [Fimbriimonadaceae bacterium]
MPAAVKTPLRSDQKLLLLAGLVALAVWASPNARPFLLPLVYLNTHLHEFCHALAGWLSGGHPHYILVNADGSGVTPTSGGSLALVAAAGYVGTSVIGALMVLMAASERGAKQALSVMAAALMVSLVLLVRGDGVGLAAGVVWIVLTLLMARFLKRDTAVFAAQFLGLQLCLTSGEAFSTLFQVSTVGMASDAQIMADNTAIPAIVWASAWFLFSSLAVLAALKTAWSRSARRRV